MVVCSPQVLQHFRPWPPQRASADIDVGMESRGGGATTAGKAATGALPEPKRLSKTDYDVEPSRLLQPHWPNLTQVKLLMCSGSGRPAAGTSDLGLGPRHTLTERVRSGS